MISFIQLPYRKAPDLGRHELRPFIVAVVFALILALQLGLVFLL